MLAALTKGLTKIFGSKSEKDIKKLMPYVEETNKEFALLLSISDDQLRAKTAELRKEIANSLKSIDDQIADLEKKTTSDGVNVQQKEQYFQEIEQLEKDRNEQLEDVLLEVLPKAFAVVKETARRLTENKQLKVTAQDIDHKIANEFSHVTIEEDQAVWANTWDAAGVPVTWEMIHYDVQLIGGVVIHQGQIAEMATGEGKTLMSTLPLYLNALAQRGVHMVTVNDYLARRDAEWMAPLFQFHNISVDCIDKYRPHSPERIAAYNADITYGTNNEFGFDYLRDNMAHEIGDLVQRKHHFAIVDEVDSVLIDDARTPLIISGPVPKGDEHEFYELKPRISSLVEEQKKIAQDYLNDAKRLLKEGNEQDGGLALFRTHRALPKYKPLIKFLGQEGMRKILTSTENIYLAENQKLMPEADKPLLFTIDEKTNQVDLTEKGLDLITKGESDGNFFILPDIAVDIDAIEKSEGFSDQEKLEKKEQLIQDFTQKTQRIHTVNQLLKAYALFEKDTEYIVVDSKVKIVDEQTGRVMDGRRYSDGLHQAIEAKENCKVEDATQTYASVTLQNYFRMYHKLSGMTGTAETEAGEFWEIYKLDCIVIPTNRSIQRDDQEDKVYKTVREKFNAVIDETVALVEQGRPVLIGTTSVEISEIFSRMLKMRNIRHQVLNAKQHAKEADVVAEAGKEGTVTIATNMAGRGTDIKLTAASKAAGGLAIIGTERHDSRRVDRQLRGRAGRQGDVGSSLFFISLEDNLMRLFGSDRIAKVMDMMKHPDGEEIQHSMISKSIERAQKKVEENSFGGRKRLLEYDDVMNAQREVVYKRRRNALYGDRLDVDLLTYLGETVEDIVFNAKEAQNYQGFKLDVLSTLAFESKIDEDTFSSTKPDLLADQLYEEALAFYQQKSKLIKDKVMPFAQQVHLTRGESVENIVIPLTDGVKQLGLQLNLEEVIESKGASLVNTLHKVLTLQIIDNEWKEHLRELDDLKQRTQQSASLEQKDPLLIYKGAAFEEFRTMIGKLNKEITSFLFKCDIPVQEASQVQA
ncbi:preprotein translocase subunit SecA, partial [Cyclobacteriaceae bacterium]|nr:preprotein translocase subunit SecA [Cyclobacteriaceae bacterium]